MTEEEFTAVIKISPKTLQRLQLLPPKQNETYDAIINRLIDSLQNKEQSSK